LEAEDVSDTKDALPGDDYVKDVASRHTREHLQAWSEGILGTAPENRALMVAEDPSVLDVAAAYILVLEAALGEAEAEVDRLRCHKTDGAGRRCVAPHGHRFGHLWRRASTEAAD